MPLIANGPAPYAPPSTVLDLTAKFRDRGLRTPFTPEVLTLAGVSDGLINRTLQTLKLLELIDESGNPTPPLEGLRRAPQAEFKQRLEAIVRDVYSQVFQFVDPAKDDTARITDAFRAFDPPGQRARMVTLFIGLCEAAGIIEEGKKPTVNAGRQRAAASQATRRSTPNPLRRDPNMPLGERAGSFGRNLRALDGDLVPAAVTGLIQSIPFNGWTEERRKAFLKTFEAVLDFTVPIVSEAEAAVDEASDNE
jgi:hypothetical protein